MHAPEIKSATDSDLSGAVETFMRTFDAYKDANDERLGLLRVSPALMRMPSVKSTAGPPMAVRPMMPPL